MCVCVYVKYILMAPLKQLSVPENGDDNKHNVLRTVAHDVEPPQNRPFVSRLHNYGVSQRDVGSRHAEAACRTALRPDSWAREARLF